jgi:hypothetical protein
MILIHDSVASYFHNIEPMRWSPYLEECLAELQKSNEYNTDPSLIMCVKMQQMVERINSSPWFDGTDQSSGWKLCPPTLYIRALQGELQALKNDLQTEFPQNCRFQANLLHLRASNMQTAAGFLSHYYSLEMTLYEIGLLKARLPQTAHSADFQRLEILYACLESVGNFFAKFLEMEPASYWNFSLVHFCQLGYALNMLQRLSSFEDPTWDLRCVTEKVNLAGVVDQICTHLEEAEALTLGGTEPPNTYDPIHIFTRTRQKLRKLSGLFEAQMAYVQPAPDDQMGGLDTGDMMNLENMAGFWDQDLFDIMRTNWG